MANLTAEKMIPPSCISRSGCMNPAKCREAGYCTRPEVGHVASNQQVDPAYLWQWLLDLANQAGPFDSMMLKAAADIVGDVRIAGLCVCDSCQGRVVIPGSSPETPDALAVLRDLEAGLDEQIYPQQLAQDFDAPDDFEYGVNLTAKQWRAICRVLNRAERSQVKTSAELTYYEGTCSLCSIVTKATQCALGPPYCSRENCPGYEVELAKQRAGTRGDERG
jgi:hypothetical protein